MKTLTSELLTKCRAYTESDKNVSLLNAVMSKTDIRDLAYVKKNIAKLNDAFEIEVKTRGITDQKGSNRCWMFAVFNVLRECAAEKCNLDAPFELSTNYLSFYDKLEKSNNILEMAIETAEKPLSDQLVAHILKGYTEGGHWSMGVDLLKKYGIVPKSVMPETHHSENPNNFMKYMTALLRKDIAELREMIARGEDPTARKEEMVAEIYKIQCIMYGEPIDVFDFEYKDKDGTYHVDRDITPLEYLDKYVGYAFDEYVNVTNYPVSFLKEDTPYSYHYSGNMSDKNIFKLNISQEAMEELCIKQLRGGELVFFGCDSNAFYGGKDGIWDPDCFVYDQLLGGISLYIDDKGKRIEYTDSRGTHNMVICGVSFDKDGKPSRWKIENSWGTDFGRNGFFVCSEKYMQNYIYEMVIHKKYLSKEQLQMLEKEPVQLDAWVGAAL